MRSFFKNSAVAFASLGISMGLVAFADPANASVTPLRMTDQGVAVSVGDLDLHSKAGLDIAKHRIHGAAEIACSDKDPRDMQGMICRQDAINQGTQALQSRVTAAL